MQKTVFDKNELVYESLAGYSTAYTEYLSCLDKSGADCNSLSTKLNNSYSELNNNIADLYNILSQRKPDDTNIKKVYDENNKLRNDLASQLEDLYKRSSSLTNEMNVNNGIPSVNNIDSSLYIGLVWTTLATACLYCIFVKL